MATLVGFFNQAVLEERFVATVFPKYHKLHLS